MRTTVRQGKPRSWVLAVLVSFCLAATLCLAAGGGKAAAAGADPASEAPTARLFDTGAPLAGPLAGEAFAARKGWTRVPENETAHEFRGDAVLLNDREYRGLQKLKTASEFEVAHTTEPFPAAIVVTFEGRLSKEGRANVENAFRELERSEAGKELLEEMGIDRFRAFQPELIAEWEKRFARATKS